MSANAIYRCILPLDQYICRPGWEETKQSKGSCLRKQRDDLFFLFFLLFGSSYNLRSRESNTRLINFSEKYHYLKLVPLLDFFNVEEITCYGRTPLIKGAFHSTQNSGKFVCYIKWNGQISVWSDRNIRDQLWWWSTLTGLIISDSRTEMSLSIWHNSCPQYRSFISLFQERLDFEQSLFCSKILKRQYLSKRVARFANLPPRNSRYLAVKILSLTNARNQNVPFHWARKISEISNRNFCWTESA